MVIVTYPVNSRLVHASWDCDSSHYIDKKQYIAKEQSRTALQDNLRLKDEKDYSDELERCSPHIKCTVENDLFCKEMVPKQFSDSMANAFLMCLFFKRVCLAEAGPQRADLAAWGLERSSSF